MENELKKYDHKPIEEKWQKVWLDERIYQPDLDSPKNPYYNLMMFPYPSAEGMHVGNMYAQTGGDIHGRLKRMQGHEVFQPMGLDGFGIHSENYALKVGSHPADQAEKSEANFYRQMRETGSGFAWDNTVETWKVDFYQWTQWVFIQLFKAGLAYRKNVPVNFCPSCKTVLADEQVIDGNCERCGSVVEKKDLEQWMFRITDYADQLLSGLDEIDWTEKIKVAQKNWIGKSQGASIKFQISNDKDQISNEYLEVFTTRPDTLYGATFMAISPEHPIATAMANGKWQIANGKKEEIQAFIESFKEKESADKGAGQDKSGIFTGAYAINPINSQHLPIWIADYVLMGYGTGAIMAVPAHDERDFEFAKKYDLEIKQVIEPRIVTTHGDGALREGEEIVKREAVCVVLRNPKDGKYLCVSWKDFKMNGLVTGGIDEGEDIKEAGMREIREETGYKNIRFVSDPGMIVNTVFYQRIKKQNRWARFHYVFYELENEEKDPISEVESQNMDVVWKSKDELADFFTVSEGEYIVDYIKGEERAYTGEGILGNSGSWDGLTTDEAKTRAIKDLEEKKIGEVKTTYHLRDWLISRQRYWGPPIPMIYCESCRKTEKSWFTTDAAKDFKKLNSDYEGNKSLMAGWYPEENLPVELPYIDDYKPIGDQVKTIDGKAVTSPLGNHPEFYEVTCPECGEKARRETDVSDTFLDSAWYFLRYYSVGDKGHAWTSSRTKTWMPAAIYTGGAEHAVLHLLYSRFANRVFHDLGLIDDPEPFPRFYAHGLIIKDGAKMSKSKGNVIIPDAYIKKLGADTLRTYLMFLGPFDAGGDFRDSGIEGMHRFIKRIWTMGKGKIVPGTQSDPSAIYQMNLAISGATKDIEGLHYNTAISKIMIYYNFLAKQDGVYKMELETLIKLLAPFAPHMTEEIYREVLHYNESIHTSSWPSYDENALKVNETTISVQINGKLRGTISVSQATTEAQAVELAKADEAISKHLEGKEIKKTIYIPQKALNFVV